MNSPSIPPSRRFNIPAETPDRHARIAIAILLLVLAVPVQAGDIETTGVEATTLSSRKQYNHGNPTHHEQLMLELVNRARANPGAEAARLGIGLNDGLAPGTIANTPKPPLAFHPKLIRSARKHSLWMLDSGVFSHTGVGQSSPDQRMRAAGYVFAGWAGSGENISWGGSSGAMDMTIGTTDRHEGLFISPPHRTNICAADFRNVGLGVRAGNFKGLNAVMATQNFGYSDAYPEPLVLGVVYEDHDNNGFYDPGEGVRGVSVIPDDGNWQAITSASGGYAIPCSAKSGVLVVKFSGGPLGATVKRSIQRTGHNLKIDLETSSSGSAAPEIDVSQPARSSLANGTGKKSFGTASVGSKGRSKTFTIRNRGTATLSILAIKRTGADAADFSVTARGKSSLKAGESSTFKVTFKPTGSGTRNATIRIKSDDADEGRFDISITGYGTPP